MRPSGADVRWGILGSGAVAGLFAEGLGFVPGARLGAVASRTPARAEALARRFRGARVHATPEALFQDPDVDAVYVATPNELHREHCLAALARGKPVLCEKPFALDAAEGRAVLAAARELGVFCMEGMWMRFSPALREALALVRRGDIGEPRLLVAELGFPHRFDQASRLFAPPGGGALLDLGVYPLSLAQAMFGRPRRVQGSAAFAPSGVDEQVSALLDYGGGQQALVAASLRARLGNGVSLHGTEGVITLDAPLYFPHRYRLERTPPLGPPGRGGSRLPARLRWHPLARSLAELRARARVRTVVRRAPGNGYGEEAAEVARCLRVGCLESPEMPHDDTLAVLETMDAIRRTWTAADGG